MHTHLQSSASVLYMLSGYRISAVRPLVCRGHWRKILCPYAPHLFGCFLFLFSFLIVLLFKAHKFRCIAPIFDGLKRPVVKVNNPIYEKNVYLGQQNLKCSVGGQL